MAISKSVFFSIIIAQSQRVFFLYMVSSQPVFLYWWHNHSLFSSNHGIITTCFLLIMAISQKVVLSIIPASSQHVFLKSWHHHNLYSSIDGIITACFPLIMASSQPISSNHGNIKICFPFYNHSTFTTCFLLIMASSQPLFLYIIMA
jgi:hypothetical protein